MTTSTMDFWTEDKCIRLIREYKARSLLWDQSNPFFFKKPLKTTAWHEIADTVNIPADQCKHKMMILMSSFRREKSKILHSIKSSSDDTESTSVYKSTWFAFKEMTFLLDKHKKRSLNDSDDNDEDDSGISDIKSTLLSHHLETPNMPKRSRQCRSKVVHDDPIPAPQTIREETQTIREEPVVQPQRQVEIPEPSQTPAERDEEILSFTSFVGNKMKKYNDRTKSAVQQAICEIIFRADQGFYNNCYEKFTIIDDAPDPLRKTTYDEQRTTVKFQVESDSD